ncbi:MAG TPA: hypothetical protein VN728_11435 [Stellaceae bacterium]|jgi:uncharacterized membrane protein YfcA|nr:hypothetical protein [Stellaceae bacterium]
MRQTLLAFLWLAVALLPVAALFSPIFFYSAHSKRRPNPERRFPVLLYIFVLLIAGVVGFFFGTIKGGEWACSFPTAGNLCGLAGVFLTGPAAAAFAMAAVGSLILLMPADPPNRDG